MSAQIRDALEHEILSGARRAGERFPPEREIQAQYEVSRITVQQAFRGLVERGLVVRRRGAGTFVAGTVREENLLHFANVLTDGVGIEGIHRVLSCSVTTPSSNDAYLLGIDVREAVIELERLKLEDGEPAALERSIIPFRLAPGLVNEPLEELHLYEWFRRRGIKLSAARVYFDPIAIDKRRASLLGVAPGTLALLWQRISFAGGGVPVELSQFILRSDRRRIYVEFSSPETSQPGWATAPARSANEPA